MRRGSNRLDHRLGQRPGPGREHWAGWLRGKLLDPRYSGINRSHPQSIWGSLGPRPGHNPAQISCPHAPSVRCVLLTPWSCSRSLSYSFSAQLEEILSGGVRSSAALRLLSPQISHMLRAGHTCADKGHEFDQQRSVRCGGGRWPAEEGAEIHHEPRPTPYEAPPHQFSVSTSTSTLIGGTVTVAHASLSDYRFDAFLTLDFRPLSSFG